MTHHHFIMLAMCFSVVCRIWEYDLALDEFIWVECERYHVVEKFERRRRAQGVWRVSGYGVKQMDVPISFGDSWDG